MTGQAPRKKAPPRGLLSTLARDVRGNTLAMMAMFLIPLTGLVGSAVDMSRLYVVKTRLQQACDAGALAGRKGMTDSNNTTLDADAVAQAQAFFANNFKKDTTSPATAGYLGTTKVGFSPSKTADNQVEAKATATVPMTVSKILGTSSVTLNVTCEARYDVADTDVMFVLDTTGSMACLASQTSGCSPTVKTYTRPDGTTGYYAQEVSGSKLSGVRTAVLNFYDTVAASADPSTHIRYGFVTYTSTVNAGFAVAAVSPTDPTVNISGFPLYLVNNWSYDTRRWNGDMNQANATASSATNVKAADCFVTTWRVPATGYTTNAQATQYTRTYSTANGGTCTLTTQPLKPRWIYDYSKLDVGNFVMGQTVPDPTKFTGATSRWQGCLEERTTTPGVTSFDQDNLPGDLDPDLIPNSDPATKWRPMWPDVVYYRGTASSLDSAANSNSGNSWSGTGSNSANPYGDSASTTTLGTWTALTMYGNIASGYVSCGKPVQRLDTLTRSQVSNYVNASDFVPQGGTYHDTGMIWGTRMISPNGIFADDTSTWPGRNPPNRYIVFMTDGDMSPNDDLYGMYGIESYRKQVAAGNSANLTTYTNYHNQRFLAECTAAKARNIKVFVIGFGQTLTPQLTACASEGQAYYASDNKSLDAAFQTIAKQVAMLRVSK